MLKRLGNRVFRLLLPVLLLVAMVIPLVPAQPVYAATVNVSVAASADDAFAYYGGSSWVLVTTDVAVNSGYIDSPYIKTGGGFRFPSVNIPSGATISTAYLVLTAYSALSNTTVNTVLIGDDEDNAAQFSTIANYQARRGTVVGGATNDNITTASVNWNSIPAWTPNTTYNSPEIKTIVQEIIGRAGWTSGNALVVFWDDHGGNSTAVASTYRNSYAYDADPAKATLLHVEYTVSAPTMDTSAATSVSSTTATLNGSVTGLGGENPTVTMYWGTSDGGVNPTNWTNSSVPTSPSQPQGNAAFYKYLTGLTPETTYYFSAKATNSGGTTWGTSRSFYTTVGPFSSTFETRVSASLDDTLVVSISGVWGIYSTDPAISVGRTVPSTGIKRGGGMRFTGVTIPQGSTITNAYISFQAGPNGPYDNNTVNSKFTGNKEGDAAAFSTIANYQSRRGTVVGGGDNTKITTAQVTWNSIPGWVLGSNYNSPDLSTIVQEIVNQSSWTSGNHMVVFWDDHDAAGTQSDYVYREAKSYNNSPSAAPLLHVEYAVSGIPTVITSSATSITTSSATLNGNIVSVGGGNATVRGFYWGSTIGYGSTVSTTGSYGTGAYTGSLTSLAPNTAYYFQAFATNAYGTSTGAGMVFATSSSEGGPTPYGGYSYAQQFTIQGSTGGAGTNIPIQLQIFKGAGTSSGSSVYLNNGSSNFPNDIIFTATDGITLIPFYQETTSTTDVWVWVNIPSIPTYPGITYGYISYGNSLQSTSLSNGRTTFTFFDDFNYASWAVYNNNTPVIALDTTGGADYLATHSAVLVNGVWHLYAEWGNELANPPWSKILHYTSTNYINWTLDPIPAISSAPGTWYAYMGDPSVQYVNGTFYLAMGGTSGGANTQWGIWSSTDGSRFTNLVVSNFPGGLSYSDDVLFYDTISGTWNLWWTQYNTGSSFTMWRLSTSNIASWNWANTQGVTSPVAGYHLFPSQVFRYNGFYYMVVFDGKQGDNSYSTAGNTYLWKSSDLVSWSTGYTLAGIGYDTKIDMQSPTYWYLTGTPKSAGAYDHRPENCLSLWLLSGADFTQVGSLAQDTAWTNYVGSSATLSNGQLAIVKSSQADAGVQYISQLPSTAVVGWKMTDYSSAASNYATMSILNKSGTGAATNEISIQQQNSGDIIAYSNTVGGSTTIQAAAPLSTRYSYVMEVQSSTTIYQLVRGYTPVTKTRTASLTNFLHFGWTPANTNFAVDDVFIGNLVTPNPAIISWAGGGASNAVTTQAATNIQFTRATLNGYISGIVSGHTITKRGFDYGTTITYGTDVQEIGTYTLGAYSLVSGVLTGGATYHFRAKMYDSTSAIWVYGQDLTFTTSPLNTPTVATLPVASITTTSVVLQGSLSSLGDYSSVFASFDYGTSPSYGYSTTEQTFTSISSFSASISNLTSSATYYYRAKARYSATGYAYGNPISFSTIVVGGAPGLNPPDIFSIEDVVVFTGWFEGGDQLFLFANKIIYTEIPIANVGDYFNTKIKDGAALKAQGTITSWGYRPASIYLSSMGKLVWGQQYNALVEGNPNKWATVPSTTLALSSTNWIGSDLSKLDTWVINLATRMQQYYGVTLTTYSPASGSTVLNSEGGKIFRDAISGLQDKRPHLFTTGIKEIKIDKKDVSPRYQTELTAEKKFGTEALAKFTALGEHIGLSGTATAGFLWAGVLLLVVGGAAAVTGSGVVGSIVAIPLIAAGAFMGLIPLALVAIFAAIIVIFMMMNLWLARS